VSRKLTQEEFVAKAISVQPQYDYSKVIYKNNTTKVKIICPVHGEFQILPKSLLRKRGCQLCSHNKTIKLQEHFIQEATKLFPHYDYSLVEYRNNKTKVKIICPVHGEFSISPHSLLQKKGCYFCGRDEIKKKLSKPKEQFIQEATKLFPHYNYSLVEYTNNKTKVKILCKKHGEFEIVPSSLLSGSGCPVCAKEKNSKTQEQFIQEISTIFPEYDYSKTIYKNDRTKVTIICSMHGEFEATPSNLLQGRGCPKCCSSKGEKKIRAILKKEKILFKEQYKIPDCKDKIPLPFDFAIFNSSNELIGLIEFQGEQHFKPIKVFGGEEKLAEQQKRDAIKREYCKTHRIPLLEVFYLDVYIPQLVKNFIAQKR
jgi:hypothetical protein